MNKNYIDDIKAEIATAKKNREHDATCRYLTLKYYDELYTMSLEDMCILFEKKPSYVAEFAKTMALARIMRRKGEL